MKRGLVLAGVVAAIASGASAGQAASPSLIVFSADRAPSLSGEIYRVDPNGRHVDLSRSPYQDIDPAVSRDGKRVAFFSDRSGVQGVYEVGTDGRGLVRVGGRSVGGPNGTTPLSWRPHGERLAVSAANGDWIVQRGRRPVRVGRAYGITGWSPDGRVLAVTVSDNETKEGGRERAVSPRGRTLWTVRNVTEGGGAAWSAHGLLAIPTGGAGARRHGIGVYDEAGRRRFNVPLGRLGRLTPAQASVGTWLTWSPDGSRLAFVSGRAFRVRTTTGRVLLRKRLRDDWAYLVWDGNARVVGYGYAAPTPKGIDVRTGKMSPASDRFVHQTSPDGRRAILTPPSGPGFAIQVARTAGGPPSTYAHVPGCANTDGGWLADASFFQFVPRSRSLVYGSDCSQPTADLYSVSASGGAVHRITSSRSDHSAPGLSPNGSEIAYSLNRCSLHRCGGGSYGIRILNVDGSGERVLTNNSECPPDSGPIETRASGDFTPTWSPGGATILFSRLTCSAGPELYTVPANGGAVRDLGLAGSQPAWGPSRIAYVVGAYVWTASPDGTDPVQIDGGESYSPAWSPDGRLAYLRGNRHNSLDNYGNTLVVGSTRTTLPFAAVSSVAWSPDGTRLVVTARPTKTAPSDVYTVKPDGTDPARVTENYGAFGASWR